MKMITGIEITSESKEIGTKITQNDEIPTVEIICTFPVIRKDQTTSGRTFTRDEIQNMPF